MKILPPIPEVLFKVTSDIPTPALVYDLEAITHILTELQHDFSKISHVEFCFAVKANRCKAVLRHMAQLGLGADIASVEELDAAIAAGLSPIYATSPAFSVSDLKRLAASGVIPDISSLSQMRVWCECIDKGQKVGLRLRLPAPAAEEPTTVPVQLSRFGVDPSDPRLHDLIQAHRLEVVHLHVHAGEPRSAEAVCRIFGVLMNCLKIFPNVEVLNLGGGWAYLFYLHRVQAKRAWDVVGRTLARVNDQRKQPVRLVLEPGMLLTIMAGYLVAEVHAADDHPSGHRVAVLDASAWNLMPWTPRWLVGKMPLREEPMLVHDFAGCTCFEDDYFVLNEKMARVEVGDRVILNAAGAYVSSMARCLHGLPIPQEWVIRDNHLWSVEE